MASAGSRAAHVGRARSAVKHRPADVIPQPLVVCYELANRLRELVTLPLALESPCALTLAFRRASTCGLDRIGGRTELVRGDVRDSPGLAGSLRGMPRCPAQVSGRGHGMAGCGASLGHRDLATHPGAGMPALFLASAQHPGAAHAQPGAPPGKACKPRWSIRKLVDCTE
jgi:hypothetical protein